MIDCPDPPTLASFYAELLEGRADTANPNWCDVHLEGSALKLSFQKDLSFIAPGWPGGEPQQLHLDLTVSDLEEASRLAVSLGATVLRGPVEEMGCHFIVHSDPAGHPFCLCSDKC